MAIPFRAIYTFFTRFVAIGFLVVAALTLPQAWKLTDSGYTRKGDTIYVPLEICVPQNITFDGEEVISLDAEGENVNCRNLENIVMACVAGIFLAMIALFLFLVFDGLARFNIGLVKQSSVLGMEFFQMFTLLQCAVCCWALYSEATSWTDAFERQLDAIEMGEISVKTHGNIVYLGVTFIMALVSAVLLLLDSFVDCCCDAKAPSEAQLNKDASQLSFADTNVSSGGQQSPQQQESMIHESESMQPENPGNGPAWSNV